MFNRVLSSGMRTRGRISFSTTTPPKAPKRKKIEGKKFQVINSEIINPVATQLPTFTEATIQNIQPLQSRTVAVISGGSGELGRRQVLNALREGSKYTHVIAVTSSPDQLKKYLIENGIQENDPRLLIADRRGSSLETAISNAMPLQVEEVEIFNTIGGANKKFGPKYTPAQLAKKNSEPTMEFIRAVGNSSVKSGVKSIAVVHYSSIAASMNNLDECLYANERKRTEDLIFGYFEGLQLERGIQTKAIALRVGFIWQDLQKVVIDTKEGEKVEHHIFDTGYEFGPHHYSHFPMILCIGSGMQTMQPIHVNDLIEGGENAISYPVIEKNMVINAVTKENEMSFIRFISLLHPRWMDESGGLQSLHIPYEIAKAGTEFAGVGHFQDYAVNYAKEQDRRRLAGKSDALCPAMFNVILGKDPIKIASFMEDKKTLGFTCPKLDLTKIAWEGVKSGVKNPRLLHNFVRDTWKHKNKVEIKEVIVME